MNNSLTTLICNDAGASNQLYHYIKNENLRVDNFILSGPAKKIFNKKKILLDDIVQILERTNILITGTSWQSNVEHEARMLAKERKIYSIAAIDHWVNYKNRFFIEGKSSLPDEIWVFDELAYKKACKEFKEIKISKKHSHYLDHSLLKIKETDFSSKKLLYVLEPYRNNWGKEELGEFQAFKYFLNNINKLELPEDLEILIKPHPSDQKGKYQSFLNISSKYKIQICNNDLDRCISECRWVVGCETYAMYVALKANRTVYCSLPPWGPNCSLPHKEIVHIKSL